MASYRKIFPNKIIQKYHILEHHRILFIAQSGFGLGLLSERDTEASHQAVAKLEKRALVLRNEKDRMILLLLKNSTAHHFSIPTYNLKKKKKWLVIFGLNVT